MSDVYASRLAPVAVRAARLAVLAALAAVSPGLRAAAQTDGSAGRVQTLSGRFTVPQSLGTLAGQNLFHSFQTFGVRPGESATFTTTSPLQNVIARVTGGMPSTINGPLKLDAAGGGKPSFFLVNPAGMTIGAGGSVDVPGALHLSTAHYLKFADGSIYRSDRETGSTFSAAAPAAFGFLGPRTGTVALRGDPATTFYDGQSVSIVAGDVVIDNATLASFGGDVRVAAVGATAVEIGLVGPLPTLAGRLTIDNGGLLGSLNSTPEETGGVTVAAGDVFIGSTANSANTGIFSFATADGAAGAIRLDAANALSLQNGGTIVSSANQAPGGTVDIRVGGTLSIGSRSGIFAVATGSGDAGGISVAVQGPVMIDGGGSAEGAGISSETFASGRSGDISVVTRSGLSLIRGGRISASSSGAGPAGRVAVEAATITMDDQAAGGTGIVSNSFGTGDAGAVDISTAGALTALSGSVVQSSTFGTGAGGAITIHAGSMLLDGRGDQRGTGIASETGGAGRAGSIVVTVADDITLRDAARISSSSAGPGNAGSVRVDSGTLRIEDARPGPNGTGIVSAALLTGNPGTIDLTVRGALSINDGVISTSTASSGQGGAVTVSADSIVIGNTGTGVRAGITSNTLGTGNAGSVAVTAAQEISVVNGATIASSTYAQGDAGTVSVRADTLRIDGLGSASDTSIASETYGRGRGGAVLVAVRDALSIVDGGISSSTFDAGTAGLVRVQAGSITLDKNAGTGRTGIGSVAASGSGNGGSVDVAANGLLSLSNGAEISANTSTLGAAGSVQVRAEQIALASGSSINSGATSGSSGLTGSVSVAAAGALTIGDSRISIENNATVAQPDMVAAGVLTVAAPRISLNRSQITASASGNVAAGNIEINQPGMLLARERSAINTSAVTGRGGSIAVRGGGVLLLDHSQLTTSITGTDNGDGGPISIESRVIVLNSGFVQANTAVAQARGGDVSINAGVPGVLVASGLQLITGGRPVSDGAAGGVGNAINGPNVIQAARPDGVNGDLGIFSPQVDLSAGLTALATPRLDFGVLGPDMCRIGDGSSLTPVGRGTLGPSFAEPLRLTQ